MKVSMSGAILPDTPFRFDIRFYSRWRRIDRLNRRGFAMARPGTDHYPDGIGLLGGTAAKEVYEGLRLRPDDGSTLCSFIVLIIFQILLRRCGTLWHLVF